MRRFLFLLSFFCNWAVDAQPILHFNKITVEDGLNDGFIQAISQDRYGYMWFSTAGGVNRFNGNTVNFYSKIKEDYGNLPASICREMVTDSNGRFFLGFENGLAEFDFNSDELKSVNALKNIWIRQILPLSDSSIYLNTFEGIFDFNPLTNRAKNISSLICDSLLRRGVNDWCYLENHIYFAKSTGLYDWNTITGIVKKIEIPSLRGNQNITLVNRDKNGIFWFVLKAGNKVVKWNTHTNEIHIFDDILLKGNYGINGIYFNKTGNQVWIATVLNGLLRYDKVKNNFEAFSHDPLKPWTPNANLIRALFFDDNGTLWMGGDEGVNYCNPGKAMFEILLPFGSGISDRNRRVARVATEDKNGDLWFGTLDGVSRFHTATNTYNEWNNRPGKKDIIYYNSIRGVVADEENNIWMITGKGINRYHLKTGKMDFFVKKDSIPPAFYFGANKDNSGNIWFCSRDYDGLFYYSSRTKKFNGIKNHPYLKKFFGYGCRYVLQDSKKRYWIGFNGMGLGMYNPANGKTTIWNDVGTENSAIAGNIVVDIDEDLNGNIWVSTFTGLSCINPTNGQVKNYTTQNGLLSNTTSAIAVDSLNRIWVGTSRGLMMLDDKRKYFTKFGSSDGLPSITFTEHAAYVTKDGKFIMPTLNGYIRFNPLHYNPDTTSIKFYIPGYSVYNHFYSLNGDEKTTKQIQLAPDENAITFHLVGLNYDNPKQTWYAYKLEGFEKDWHYTQNDKAVYTNVPGGNYIFKYKAGTNVHNWKMPEKKIAVTVAIVFYKSRWFALLAGLFTVGCIYLLYRLRLAQQQQLLDLKSKTQLLEKEKALVMYENLKQHLNPHFLFNSLTSLSSLIRLDQDMAGNFLERMSKIYRYILKNRDSETVTLQDELDFVATFIELQKTRFETGLEVNISVPEEFLYRKIAPVTLQNLVENAIKHNTISKNKPLKIDMFIEGEYLLVRNNLQLKNSVETSNKQGLQSMKSLYSYMTETPLLILEDENYFVVKVPML
ncbi:MAG: two-component regulator propeller domain-containing protein [Bacteroidota bacterium]